MSPRSISAVDERIAVLNGKIEILRKQETDYDTLISHLQNLKAAVTQEIETLSQTKLDLESSKIPINWLPNEVLARIFTSVVEGMARSVEPSLQDVSTVIMQVSRRWRSVAESTLEVWSFIDMRHRWNASRIQELIQRSGSIPLTIFYESSPNLSILGEITRIELLLHMLAGQEDRLRSVSITAKTVTPLASVIRLLNNPSIDFVNLSSLALRVSTPDPPYSHGSELLKTHESIPQHPGPRPPVPEWCCLTHLKLDEIPLLSLRYPLFASLRSLELGYPPRRIRAQRYHLKLSSLIHFLSTTLLLEELTLADTKPAFDVKYPNATSSTTANTMQPVKLPELKTINWTFPSPEDVHCFFSFIECPRLEKLDIWIEPSPNREYVPSSPDQSLPQFIDFHSVRELIIQCPDDRTISSLRKFAFPNVERLEIANDPAHPSSSSDRVLPMTLPRLEGVFRDPRMYALSHLELFGVEFDNEYLSKEAFLGYMPLLLSLTLESCTGVDTFLKPLQARFSRVVISSGGDGKSPMKQQVIESGVKACPRLESLSFWHCKDLTVDSLLKLVRARNTPASKPKEPINPDLPDIGALDLRSSRGNKKSAGRSKPSVMQMSPAKPSQTAIGSSKAQNSTSVMGREIKPLRRSVRSQAASLGLGGPGERREGGVFPAGPHCSVPLLVHEALEASPIVYIRFHECARVGEHDAQELRRLGVLDVVWMGGERKVEV